MKKIGLFAVTLVTAFFLLSNLSNKNKTILSDEKEIRGIFISYIEYKKEKGGRGYESNFSIIIHPKF